MTVQKSGSRIQKPENSPAKRGRTGRNRKTNACLTLRESLPLLSVRLSTFFLVLNCLFILHVKGQGGLSDFTCLSQLKKSYITDGQDHQLLIVNSKFSQLHVVFYPQFTYKIVVCAKNESAVVEFNVSNEHGNIIFDNATSNYIKEWDFTFDSLLKGVINVKLASKDVKEETVKIVMGYKIADKK